MTNKRTFGSVRELRSGRFQARYPNPVKGAQPTRINAPHLFTTRQLANKWLSKIETAISNETWEDPNAPKPVSFTFEEYAKIWMNQNSKDHSPRYKNELHRMLAGDRLKPFHGLNIKDDITREFVDAWHLRLPATPTENANVYGMLRTILADAADRRLIPYNPCQIKNGSKKKRKKVITILSDQQIKDLATATIERYRVMNYIAAYCCLRFGEITELRRGDYVDGELRIRRAVTWVEYERMSDADRAKLPKNIRLVSEHGRPRKWVPVVGPPKSDAGVRDIPVPEFIRPMLAEHLLKFAAPGANGLIFPAEKRLDEQMLHGSLYGVFKVAREKIGRTDLAWHHLRHTGAVTWAIAGDSENSSASVKELMTLLGHETPEMAMHYQHVAAGRLRILADLVSKKVLGGLVTEELTIEVDEKALKATAD